MALCSFFSFHEHVLFIYTVDIYFDKTLTPYDLDLHVTLADI